MWVLISSDTCFSEYQKFNEKIDEKRTGNWNLKRSGGERCVVTKQATIKNERNEKF